MISFRPNIYHFIIILVLISIFYICFDRIHSRYFRYKLDKCYSRLTSDVIDDNSQDLIKNGEKIPRKTVMDHYKIGSTYLLHFKDKERAYAHFRNAINNMIEQPQKNGQNPLITRRDMLRNEDIAENIYVIGRIEDMRNLVPELRDLPLQRALLRQYEEKKREQKNNKDEESKKKVWQSDAQNVHDQNINDDFAKQFIEALNDPQTLYISKDMNSLYEQAMKWIKDRYLYDKERTKKINAVEKTLNMNYPIHLLSNSLNTKEKDIISVLWMRALHPENAKNSETIKTAIADGILDCVEGQNVVCSSGRAPKLWQSLAKLDYRPYMGIFKSKQAIRSEIYDAAAKIRDTEKTIENAKKRILDMRPIYEGKLSEAELAAILQECCDNI